LNGVSAWVSLSSKISTNKLHRKTEEDDHLLLGQFNGSECLSSSVSCHAVATYLLGAREWAAKFWRPQEEMENISKLIDTNCAADEQAGSTL
jgi:hypothetical protein